MVMGISLWINLAGRPEGFYPAGFGKDGEQGQEGGGFHDGPCFQGSMD